MKKIYEIYSQENKKYASWYHTAIVIANSDKDALEIAATEISINLKTQIMLLGNAIKNISSGVILSLRSEEMDGG